MPLDGHRVSRIKRFGLDCDLKILGLTVEYLRFKALRSGLKLNAEP